VLLEAKRVLSNSRRTPRQINAEVFRSAFAQASDDYTPGAGSNIAFASNHHKMLLQLLETVYIYIYIEREREKREEMYTHTTG